MGGFWLFTASPYKYQARRFPQLSSVPIAHLGKERREAALLSRGPAVHRDRRKGSNPAPRDSHEEKHLPHPLHHRGLQRRSPRSGMVGFSSAERAFFRDALQPATNHAIHFLFFSLFQVCE